MYLNLLTSMSQSLFTPRLTVTWDVFKFRTNRLENYRADRLTVTWDVFKFFYLYF